MTTARLNKVLLHGCPRCRGDLFLRPEDEMYGCLQCGRDIPAVRFEAAATIDRVLAAAMTPAARFVPRVVQRVEEERNDDAA